MWHRIVGTGNNRTPIGMRFTGLKHGFFKADSHYDCSKALVKPDELFELINNTLIDHGEIISKVERVLPFDTSARGNKTYSLAPAGAQPKNTPMSRMGLPTGAVCYYANGDECILISGSIGTVLFDQTAVFDVANPMANITDLSHHDTLLVCNDPLSRTPCNSLKMISMDEIQHFVEMTRPDKSITDFGSLTGTELHDHRVTYSNGHFAISHQLNKCLYTYELKRCDIDVIKMADAVPHVSQYIEGKLPPSCGKAIAYRCIAEGKYEPVGEVSVVSDKVLLTESLLGYQYDELYAIMLTTGRIQIVI